MTHFLLVLVHNYRRCYIPPNCRCSVKMSDPLIPSHQGQSLCFCMVQPQLFTSPCIYYRILTIKGKKEKSKKSSSKQIVTKIAKILTVNTWRTLKSPPQTLRDVRSEQGQPSRENFAPARDFSKPA
jgi:hypothetical protein